MSQNACPCSQMVVLWVFVMYLLYLSRHITTRSSTRSLRSSSAPLLHVSFRRTSFGKRSFSTAAPSVWNSLPVSVQNCDTLTLFKSRLKAHLFSSVFASELTCSPAPLKPRQHGALQILYCIVLYCIVDGVGCRRLAWCGATSNEQSWPFFSCSRRASSSAYLLLLVVSRP